MIKTSLLVALLATASLINAQQSGVITVKVNTTTTFNGSVTNNDLETLALNYTIGEIGNEEFSWNNEWYAEESGVNEYELLDNAGDIIYLVPNGPNDQAQDVDEVLASPVTAPNGNNSTIGSFVGNSLTKTYLPGAANVQSQPAPAPVAAVENAPAVEQPQQVPIVISAPAPAAELPEVIESVENQDSEAIVLSEQQPAVLTILPAAPVAEVPEVSEAVENVSENVAEGAQPSILIVPSVVPVTAQAPESVEVPQVSEAAENVSVNAPEAGETIIQLINPSSSAPVPEVNEAVENVAENTAEAVDEAGENVSSGVVSDVEQVYENVESSVGEAVNEAAANVESAVEAVENAVDEARNASENVVVSYSESYNYSSSGNQ